MYCGPWNINSFRPLISVLHYSFSLRSSFLYTGSVFHYPFELWLPELHPVFLESSPPSNIASLYLCSVLCVYAEFLFIPHHNLYSTELGAGSLSACSYLLMAVICWLIAFFGCGFQDKSIFRGWSTQCIPRSVTFHLTVWIHLLILMSSIYLVMKSCPSQVLWPISLPQMMQPMAAIYGCIFSSGILMKQLHFLIRKFKTKTKVIWKLTRNTTTLWHLSTDSGDFFSF